MYDKKILKALELPALPAKRTDAVYRTKKVNYIVKTGFAMDGNLLIAAFFEREAAAAGFSLPTAVLYQTKDEFITRFTRDGKQTWRKSRIMEMLKASSGREFVCLTKSDEGRLRSFIPGKKEYYWQSDDACSRLGYYQNHLLALRMAEKLRRCDENVRTIIQAAPPAPEDFEDWIRRGPLDQNQYVFYKRASKRKASAFCTACRTGMVIEENLPRHLNKGACPRCGHKVTFKAIGLAANTTDNLYTSLLQETGNGEYALRFFQTSCTYTGDSGGRRNTQSVTLLPKIRRTEVARVYFNGEGDVTDQFKCKPGRGWYRTRNRIVGDNVQWQFRLYYQYIWHYWFEPGYLYPHNLRPLFDKLGISYTLIEKLSAKPVDVTTQILQNVKYPFAESLAAKGLRTLYQDLMYYGRRFQHSRRNGMLHECLCVPKSFLSIVQKRRLGVKDIDLAASYGTELSEDDFLWLAVEKPPRDIMGFLLEFCGMTEIRRYLMEKLIQQGREDAYNNKLETQMVWWRDYLSVSKGMNRDMANRAVLFPHSLKEAHDTIMRFCPETPNPFWDKKISGCLERLRQNYCYENGGFLIRPPADYRDFAVEGNTLNHCVCKNQYYIKHVQGTSLIFFVRKTEEPETPLYTIEYHPREHRLMQFYGHSHCKPDSDAFAFVDDWLSWVGTRKRRVEKRAA